MKGAGLSGQVELEINGLVVAPSREIALNSSGRKLQLKASRSELNLRGGANQVQVISNGARSNAFTLTL